MVDYGAIAPQILLFFDKMGKLQNQNKNQKQ